ncbi:class I SAM-dependent methyltransferase [Archangium violaceum]|uniref:class I SAM-dependent methyltransferase n=1 Tax=Archangium violaceum TaxID=83451 RepID=UPI000696D95E|nr:class I SAM-dependent methyltransferase [Archangium violaceum]
MAEHEIPERLRWAVEQLAIEPDARVLEIGCGTGVALGLVCEYLSTGHILGIDRSAVAIDRARTRNAAHIAEGMAGLWLGDLKDFASDAGAFDRVFAVNVNVFWTGPARAELQRLFELTKPGGVVLLVYEAPDARKAERIANDLHEKLTAQGFLTTSSKGPSPKLVGITALHPPAGPPRPTGSRGRPPSRAM